MDNDKLRDYGFGSLEETGGEITGTPVWEVSDKMVCPNCGAKVCDIQVSCNHSMIRGTKANVRYMGCPACPWASPALISSVEPIGSEGNNND